MSIKKVLINISDTLSIENSAIPGAVEALRRLRESKVQVEFVTNSIEESRRMLHERLNKLGFDLKEDEVWTSSWAARSFILDLKLTPLLLVDNHVLEDFTEVCTSGKMQDSVVIALSPEKLNYSKLNDAFRLIKSGAKLIAVDQSRCYESPSGLSLGPGMIVKGLEYATNCKAIDVGKPSAVFFKAVLGDIDPSEAVMIGNDAQDDIGGAQAIGMIGILVRTGQYKEGDENRIYPPPTYIVRDFPEAVDIILNCLKNDDTSEKFKLANIESPDEFYITEARNVETSEAIERNLLSVTPKEVPKKLKRGVIYGAKCGNNLRRVVFIKNISKNLYTVFCVDTGRHLNICKNEIFLIPRALKEIPKLAKHCQLKKPVADAEWPQEITSLLLEIKLFTRNLFDVEFFGVDVNNGSQIVTLRLQEYDFEKKVKNLFSTDGNLNVDHEATYV